VAPMKRIANYGLAVILVIGLAGIGVAQNPAPSSAGTAPSGQSLGDYARQVRKTPSSSPTQPKVFDNDNLPKSDKLSVVGKVAPPEKTETTEEKAASTAANEAKPAEGAKPAAGENAPAKPEDEATKQTAQKQWDDKLKAQQDQVDLLTRELDVVQREYQLRAAAMYADVGNRLRNSADWDKQDSQYKQQIADKQKAIEDAKAKLEELREEARKAGAQSSSQSQ
jgi:hypothetical protein